MATAATTVLQIMIAAAVLLGGTIVLGRAVRQAGARRRARLAAPARRILLALATGDDDPSLTDALAAVDAATWRAIEPTVVGLLGKVRGEAHTALVAVLERRGMADRALSDVRRRGAVRRARAAEVLGNLGRRDALHALHRLLTDPDPDVRTGAARALGRIGDPDSVDALLRCMVGARPVPPQFVVQALLRLGPAAQTRIQAGLDHPHELVRATVAEVLGLAGAITATGRIEDVLRADPSLEVRLRAARALGKLGTRSALVPLLDAVGPAHPAPLRAVAVRAPGELGAVSTVPTLAALLGDPEHAVAHRAAHALLRLGRAGQKALRESAAGVARTHSAAGTDAGAATDAGTGTDAGAGMDSTAGARAAAYAREALAVAAVEERRRAAGVDAPVEPEPVLAAPVGG